MIGPHPTGTMPDVVISAVAHEGLSILVNGQPAQLAVVMPDGRVVSIGAHVAREVEAVSVNAYRGYLAGQGHLRVRA